MSIGALVKPAAKPYVYRFNVREFEQMHEGGIFRKEDRVELLDGEIFVQSEVTPPHVGLLMVLGQEFALQSGDLAHVSVRLALQLNPNTLAYPDLTLLAERDDHYMTAYPRSDDALLVMEVADNSLEFDRSFKLPRYAAAGIPEVWIVDIKHKAIEQYCNWDRGVYTQMNLMLAGDALTTREPNIRISIEELFRGL